MHIFLLIIILLIIVLLLIGLGIIIHNSLQEGKSCTSDKNCGRGQSCLNGTCFNLS